MHCKLPMFSRLFGNRTYVIYCCLVWKGKSASCYVSHKVYHKAMEAVLAKKPYLGKKIGTHNGNFHCDEVLACFMLRQLPEYKDAEIIRTRDPGLLDKCDIVVDVGGVYDPDNHRYDHHQRSFTGNMQSLTDDRKQWTTKLSSAGLVYLHFGHRVLGEMMSLPVNDPIADKIYDKIYSNFIEEVDAIDNGISQTDGEPRYEITTNLSSRVGGFNPQWNDPDPKPDEQFLKALEMVGAEFLDRVLYYKDCWLPARSLVQKAIKLRYEVDKSGEIIELEGAGCPWKQHLYELEKELDIEKPIKFVIYSDNNGKWRIQCVSVRAQSFENRLSLLEKWRGIRDDELSKLSGIPGCVFVHASGFIGGNKTKDGVLEMARQTLSTLSTQ